MWWAQIVVLAIWCDDWDGGVGGHVARLIDRV